MTSAQSPARVLFGTSPHLREAHSDYYHNFEIRNRGLEDDSLHRAHQYVSALFLTAALMASGPILAAAVPQDASVQVRIYDSNHHDYHNWDDREDHAYRGYLEQRHEKYHPYGSWHSKEQKNYWKWRHNHPDHN